VYILVAAGPNRCKEKGHHAVLKKVVYWAYSTEFSNGKTVLFGS